MALEHDISDLVGIGLYTVPEAARLTGVPSQSIRRWLLGYTWHHDDDARNLPPVWTRQIPKIDDTVGLGFLDLMEIRFVQAFRRHGVSLKVIRETTRLAAEIFNQSHPFTSARFMTDGRRIFAEIVEKEAKKLIDLVKSQYAFHRVIKPSLYESIEFSKTDQAIRWYPKWPNKQIIVDPQRAFGRPIVIKGAVPTDILANAAKVEESVEDVAHWYDVPVRSVREAVKFERELPA